MGFQSPSQAHGTCLNKHLKRFLWNAPRWATPGMSSPEQARTRSLWPSTVCWALRVRIRQSWRPPRGSQGIGPEKPREQALLNTDCLRYWGFQLFTFLDEDGVYIFSDFQLCLSFMPPPHPLHYLRQSVNEPFWSYKSKTLLGTVGETEVGHQDGGEVGSGGSYTRWWGD